jgi:prevent-host-death family protein
MAVTVGAFEAKTKLSELLDRVERGEEVLITRHGKEVAKLVAVEKPPRDKDAVLKTLMEIGERGRRIREERGLDVNSLDHDELFYDENGLFK